MDFSETLIMRFDLYLIKDPKRRVKQLKRILEKLGLIVDWTMVN